MEGYHWASVASPNETPIVTSWIYPKGVPSFLSPSLDTPPSTHTHTHGHLVVWSPLFSSLITFALCEGLGGGWQRRSGWLQRRASVPG